jgi:hypothetical protein
MSLWHMHEGWKTFIIFFVLLYLIWAMNTVSFLWHWSRLRNYVYYSRMYECCLRTRIENCSHRGVLSCPYQE